MFAQMSEADKQAFFALLDEYFASRPHLFGQSSTTTSIGKDTTTISMPTAQAKSLASSAINKFAHRNDPPPPTNNSAPPPKAAKPPSAGLVSGKSLGGMNTSSFKSALGSMNKLTVTQAEKDAMRAPPKALASHSPTAAAPAARLPPPPSRSVPLQQSRGIGTATALYDYPGADEGDLVFSENAHITILEKISDDWWKGELNGKEGLFPVNYVQEN